MSTNVKFTLRDKVKFRILKEMLANLKQKFPSVANFIMVLDPTTTKIISASVKPVDLIEEGVLAFERLELGRKQFPQTHAIYFVTPSADSVNAIINDFADADDPQYGNVHLFFTNKVDSQLFSKLKSKKSLVERVLTFKEINLDFITTEPNVFHLEMDEALPTIFSRAGQPETKALEERIATSLSTIIPNLISFDNFHIVYNKNSHNQVSQRIARMVEGQINKFLQIKKANGDDDDSDEDEAPVPVKIVILDRTFDPLTPSLRDYYYESLVYEFLNVQGNIIEYEDKNNEGQMVKKKAVLDDKDEVWEKHKNQFINEAKVNIGTESQDFIRNNATAQMRRTMKLEDMDSSQLAELLQGMPAFEELFGKYLLHTILLENIDKIFAEKNLAEIGNLEQCLATGFDEQGKPIPSQKLIAMIAQKIAQGKLDDMTKLRLMIITSFALELNERERKSLTQSLPEDGKDILAKLSWLGLGEQKHALLSGRLSNKMHEPQNPNPSKTQLKNIPRTLCRHVPLIDSIAQDMTANRVDPRQYGSIYLPDTYDGTFTSGSPKKKNKRDEDLSRLPKLILFVVGGITHAELRVLSEYEKSNSNINVLVGSTAIMTVQEYINGINDMASNREHQVINIDDEE